MIVNVSTIRSGTGRLKNAASADPDKHSDALRIKVPFCIGFAAETPQLSCGTVPLSSFGEMRASTGETETGENREHKSARDLPELQHQDRHRTEWHWQQVLQHDAASHIR